MYLKIKHWLLPTLWSVLIFYLSSIPSLKITENTFMQQLVNIGGHFTEYAVLTLLLIKPLKTFGKYTTKYLFTIPFIYSFTDEFHQYFVPGRTPDIKDIMVDTIGIAAIIWLTKKERE